MFCFQCEQTAKGEGCTKIGVCGKQPDVAALQDLLIYVTKGLSQVALAARKGIPVPAFSTALAFYDSYRSAWLPANLLQAQRDYFGAHTYERTDRPRGEFFHTNWTGKGGTTASSTYNA